MFENKINKNICGLFRFEEFLQLRFLLCSGVIMLLVSIVWITDQESKLSQIEQMDHRDRAMGNCGTLTLLAAKCCIL